MRLQGVEGGNEIQSAVINVVKQCDSDEGVSVSAVTGQLKSKFSEAQVGNFDTNNFSNLGLSPRLALAPCHLSHVLMRSECPHSSHADWCLQSDLSPDSNVFRCGRRSNG